MYYRYNIPSISPMVWILYAALLIFLLAAMWRIFTKAGEKGWKCLIPIYNAYIYWRIAWDESKFWVLFGGGIGISVLNLILGRLGRVGLILSLIVAVIWLIYTIYLVFKAAITMAHRFNKSTAFGVLGLVFFSIIGIPILAFGQADYDARRDLG